MRTDNEVVYSQAPQKKKRGKKAKTTSPGYLMGLLRPERTEKDQFEAFSGSSRGLVRDGTDVVDVGPTAMCARERLCKCTAEPNAACSDAVYDYSPLLPHSLIATVASKSLSRTVAGFGVCMMCANAWQCRLYYTLPEATIRN